MLGSTAGRATSSVPLASSKDRRRGEQLRVDVSEDFDKEGLQSDAAVGGVDERS